MKICIITCVLIREAEAERNEDLEKWIREELEGWKEVLWCKALEKVKVLSNRDLTN